MLLFFKHLLVLRLRSLPRQGERDFLGRAALDLVSLRPAALLFFTQTPLLWLRSLPRQERLRELRLGDELLCILLLLEKN
jgi:hypothetical protein